MSAAIKGMNISEYMGNDNNDYLVPNYEVVDELSEEEYFEMFQSLKNEDIIKKVHGTLVMPSITLLHDGVSMFQWIHHQKKSYKMGELSLYQRESHENMGIQWIKPKQVVGWEKGYQYASSFMSKMDICLPLKNISDDGFELGEWIWEQRDRYLGLQQECIKKTEKPFSIGRNYRYKNFALGEMVGQVIQ